MFGFGSEGARKAGQRAGEQKQGLDTSKMNANERDKALAAKQAAEKK